MRRSLVFAGRGKSRPREAGLRGPERYLNNRYPVAVWSTIRIMHYHSGEPVRIGDSVKTVGGRTGVITEILLPGTEVAKQFSCQGGGVIVMEKWDGVESPLVIAVPGANDWDDVELLHRNT